MVDSLNQVWMNLIQNALQAMNYKGQIKITSRYDENDDKIIVSVEDNGPGIPKEIQEDVFKPFFTTKAQGEGSGIGLSFIKNH